MELVRYMSVEDLAILFMASQTASTTTAIPRLMIIDVRDDDMNEDGHIPGAWSLPFKKVSKHGLLSEVAFDNLVEFVIAELGFVNQNKEIDLSAASVVFHCAFSQVRGVRAAHFFNTALSKYYAEHGLFEKPTVYILKGGFKAWLRSFFGQSDYIAKEPFSKQKLLKIR